MSLASEKTIGEERRYWLDGNGMKLCPNCGMNNPADASFCQSCGTQLGPALRYERGHLSRKSAIGVAILFVGSVFEIKGFEGSEVHWYMVVIGALLVFIGFWGAFWDFSKSYWHANLYRLIFIVVMMLAAWVVLGQVFG